MYYFGLYVWVVYSRWYGVWTGIALAAHCTALRSSWFGVPDLRLNWRYTMPLLETNVYVIMCLSVCINLLYLGTTHHGRHLESLDNKSHGRSRGPRRMGKAVNEIQTWQHSLIPPNICTNQQGFLIWRYFGDLYSWKNTGISLTWL